MWRLAAHNHWFAFKFFGKEVRLCARCTGYYFGFFLLQFFNVCLPLDNFYKIEVTTQIIVSLLCVVPFAIDWITQSWRLRDSNNLIRFITGGLLGIGASLLSSVNVPYNLKFIVYVCSAMIILSLGMFGKVIVKFQSGSNVSWKCFVSC